MGIIGRKITRFGRRIGRKLLHNHVKIGRKISKVGRILGEVSPFLSAIPLLGPELALGTGAVAAASGSVGHALQARNGSGVMKRAGSDLASTYGAYRSQKR